MFHDYLSKWWQRRHRRKAAKRSPTPRQRPRRSYRLCLEQLECRQLLSAVDPFSSAIPIVLDPSQPQTGVINQAPTHYGFTVTDSGRFTAEVAPTGGATRLTLLNSDGQVLMQSDGQSASNPDDLIDLHLLGTAQGISYYLRVEGLSTQPTTYTLTTGFTPSTAPFQPMPVGDQPSPIVTGDFNADGRLDMATGNILSKDVSILLGRGDGTFGRSTPFNIDKKPYGLVAGDFNGDGKLDLATANTLSTTAAILLGGGNGTFGAARLFDVGLGMTAISAGDFNRDGKLDLVMGCAATNSVSVLLGRGDGTFGNQTPFTVGEGVAALVVGDFNNDGRLDVATANSLSDSVSLLLGRGDGTFADQTRYAVGSAPKVLVAADFNGDGRLDLAAANSDSVSVLLGRGDGTFGNQTLFAIGVGVAGLVAADFNGDGRLDLAAANSNSVSVLLGRGDGTFVDQAPLRLVHTTGSLTVGDFNGDGNLDLASADAGADQVSVFLGRGEGSFQAPEQNEVDATDFSFTKADVDNDGRLDLVTANFTTNDVLVMTGQQDGTFQIHGHFATGVQPKAVVAGDFNGDGAADLATANQGSNSVSVLLGRGDGTFGEPLTFAVGSEPIALVSGDFDKDGRLDLAVLNNLSNDISILLGRGDGTFSDEMRFAVGSDPKALVTGDFNEDGHLDLISTNDDKTMSVLLGRGDGTFTTQTVYSTGNKKKTVIAGDFNGDGHLDLATHSTGATEISVFLGRGNGSFAPQKSFKTGAGRYYLTTMDVNGDGRLDLVAASYLANSVFIYLGQGDGTFHAGAQVVVGARPGAILTGDFNSDRQLDLATANTASSDVSILLNRGDCTFSATMRTAIATGPVAMAGADFNHDSYLDLVTINPTTGAVDVSLNNGDGTFQASRTVPLEGEPSAAITGDFNRDGRQDIAVAGYLSNSVSVLLGVGDGTFGSPVSFTVGSHPVALVTGDLNGDGITDLAVANFGSSTVSILVGRGDGTFTAAQQNAAGEGPASLAVADVNADGKTDLVVANSLSRSLSILQGAGDGTFQLIATLSLKTTPSSVVTGDFNNDNKLDIAAAEPTSNAVSVLLGTGDGTFQSPVQIATGTAPASLVAGDFNGDRRLDLATANNSSNDVTVLLGRGDGTFQAHAPFAVGTYPLGLLAKDINNDGRLDILTANALSQPISVGLGLNTGSFALPELVAKPLRSTPVVADFNGDGRPDVAVLRQDGAILVRFATPASPGAFDPPVIVNREPGAEAHQISFVTAFGQTYLGALSVRGDSLVIYGYKSGDGFNRIVTVAVPNGFANHMVVGDLNGDGNDDVVFTDPTSQQALVYTEQDYLSGGAPLRIGAGPSPSNIALVDVDGDHRLDIVVTDQFNGGVRVFYNDPAAPFARHTQFRAGIGLIGLVTVGDTRDLHALDAPTALVAGQFDDHAGEDLVVVNQGANRIALLRNDGHGGFLNPESPPGFITGNQPVAVAAGRFDADRYLDLAVLNKGSADVSIFRGDGHGGFRRLQTISAGNRPTGLEVADINGDGKLDLMVANVLGDVLTLLGNGDGTFRPYQRIDRHIGLAVAELSNDHHLDFVFANQSFDHVTIHSSQDGQTFQQARQDGILAPNSVNVADLTGDGIPDLIVANGGSNDVLVYVGLGNDQFGSAHRFFVGTDPNGVTVSDLNGDGILDLVVSNTGSNDVSVLLGQGQGADWTLTSGPRLDAGAGSIATVVQDVNGDGIGDILVANSESNNVYLLPGVGYGFFNDKNPVIYQTGDHPLRMFVGNFDNLPGLDLVTVNAGSNDLTFFSGFGAGRTVKTGGTNPVAALANDFNHDGASDLIVASKDGNFTLLLGSSNGPQVANTLALPGIVNVSDLALGSVNGDSVEFYVTTEGNEAAFLGSFLFDQHSVASSGAVSTAETLAEAASHHTTEFSSPSGSPLEIVATLILDSADSSPLIPAREAITSRATDEESAMVTEADDAAGEVDRNALIMGVADMPIQQHLNGPENAEGPSLDVPFASPLEWFDGNSQAPFNPHLQGIIDEISRCLPAADASSRPAIANEQRGPVAAKEGPGPCETELPLGHSGAEEIDRAPPAPELPAQFEVAEAASWRLSPGRLFALAVSLVAPLLIPKYSALSRDQAYTPSRRQR